MPRSYYIQIRCLQDGPDGDAFGVDCPLAEVTVGTATNAAQDGWVERVRREISASEDRANFATRVGNLGTTLARGEKILFIKSLRQLTGLSLREAKGIADEIFTTHQRETRRTS